VQRVFSEASAGTNDEVHGDSLTTLHECKNSTEFDSAIVLLEGNLKGGVGQTSSTCKVSQTI